MNIVGTVGQIANALQPILNSGVVVACAPVILSSTVGAGTALLVFWLKSREPLSASVTWQWRHHLDGSYDEEPYLTVQNRSGTPAFLKNARILRGNFLKLEVFRYAFDFDEIDQGNFPLRIAENFASSFPISRRRINMVLSRAWLPNRWIGYIFKRTFVWIEITTIAGVRIVIPANDASDFERRPLWIERRWLPLPKPDWQLGDS